MDWSLLFQGIIALASIVGVSSIIVAVKQLRTMQRQSETIRHQIKDSQEWNRMNSAFLHLPKVHELNDLESELNASFVKLIDRKGPLTDDEVDELCKPENNRIMILLKNYLNMLEFYCTAINFGLIEDSVAKAIYRYKFDRHYNELEPYIIHLRTIQNSKLIMCELQETVDRWRVDRPPRKRYGEKK